MKYHIFCIYCDWKYNSLSCHLWSLKLCTRYIWLWDDIGLGADFGVCLLWMEVLFLCFCFFYEIFQACFFSAACFTFYSVGVQCLLPLEAWIWRILFLVFCSISGATRIIWSRVKESEKYLCAAYLVFWHVLTVIDHWVSAHTCRGHIALFYKYQQMSERANQLFHAFGI